MFQEPVLFAGTIRMNLDPLDSHTDEQLWRALEHAHLQTFIEALPEKLNFECGEGGQNLRLEKDRLNNLYSNRNTFPCCDV